MNYARTMFTPTMFSRRRILYHITVDQIIVYVLCYTLQQIRVQYTYYIIHYSILYYTLVQSPANGVPARDPRPDAPFGARQSAIWQRDIILYYIIYICIYIYILMCIYVYMYLSIYIYIYIYIYSSLPFGSARVNSGVQESGQKITRQKSQQ